MEMLQSNMYYFMNIYGHIVSTEEIYGVLSLSMEFYLCLWSSILVYGVLSLYAVVGCMYMETFGCKVYAFWVHF